MSISASSITELFLRETGNSMFHPANLSEFATSPTSSPVQETFSTYFKGSSAVWLGSRYNLTFSLDSRGRVTMYNSFLGNSGTALINSPDHAFKCMISDDYLYVLLKSTPANITTFLKYKLTDLQVSAVSPERLLEQVQVPFANILEVNERDLLVTLANGPFLQVWNLTQAALVQQFSYSADLSFRFNSGVLAFFQQSQKKTFFGVLRNGELKSFSFNSDNEVYFCELAQGKLIIGMKGCHLQVVDVETLDIELVQKGNPRQLFYLPLHDQVLAFFPSQEVLIIGQEIVSLQLKGREFSCCETQNDLLVTSIDGFSYLNWCPINLNDLGKRLVSIGINPDTRQIICAEKGQVHIFD